MTNTVFANGLEVACKISDGKSVAAFPDPCWSPPSPPAGPVVIPYANTAYAKDLANGSKTVFIGGKPIVLKDKSYLKTSTGNEGATRSFAQGVVTGTIKGKAYFTSWSMNVMVEGMNVTRHTDLTTHNHGSSPGNTAAWAYLSKNDVQGKCKKDIKRVQKKCAVSRHENEAFREKQEKRNKHRLKRKHKTHQVRNKTWKDKHCKLLVVKPGIQSLQAAEKELKNEINALKQEMAEHLEHDGLAIIKDAAGNYAVRSVEKYATGLGCGIFGLPGAAACETIMTICNVIDGFFSVISTGMEIWEARGVAEEMLRKYQDLEKFSEGLEEFKDAMEMGKGSPEYNAIKDKLEDRANLMKDAAEADPCTRARRCMLVPWDAKAMQGPKNNRVSKGDFLGQLFGDHRGCCPGQTGHHLVPDSWAKNACSHYQDAKAPVVCAEGVRNDQGSHGDIHTAMDQSIDECREKFGKWTPISVNQAINMAADSHKKTVGKHCNKKCIKAQLHHYYDRAKCKEMVPTFKGEEGQSAPNTGIDGTMD